MVNSGDPDDSAHLNIQGSILLLDLRRLLYLQAVVIQQRVLPNTEQKTKSAMLALEVALVWNY